MVFSETSDWDEKLDRFLADRTRETFDLVMLARLRMFHGQKPFLPIFPQMSGMGKTAVSLLFPEVLKRPPEATTAKRKEVLSDIKTGVAWSLFNFEVTPEEEAQICDQLNPESTLLATLAILLTKLRYRDDDMMYIYALQRSKPLLITAAAHVDPLDRIRDEICNLLLPNSAASRAGKCTVTARDIVEHLNKVSDRKLVLVIDKHSRWTDEMYEKAKGALADWLKSGVVIIFAGISTKTVLAKRTDPTTLRLTPIPLSPLGESHIQEIVQQAMHLSEAHGPLKGAPGVQSSEMKQLAADLLTATGGHSRAVATFVKDKVWRRDYSGILDPVLVQNVLSIDVWIVNHFTALVNGKELQRDALQSVALPAIVIAAVNGNIIETDVEVCADGSSMTYGDVLVGFPLPIIPVTATSVKFDVGKLFLPSLVKCMFDLIRVEPVTGDPRMPIVHYLGQQIEHRFGSVDVGTLFEEIFTASMLWHCMVAKIRVKQRVVPLKLVDVLPFLKSLGVGDDIKWPVLANEAAFPSDHRANLRRPDVFLDATTVGSSKLLVGEPQHKAIDVAFLMPTLHFLVQLRCLKKTEISWATVKKEWEKFPTDAYAAYATTAGTVTAVRAIFLVLATGVCKGLA